MAYLKMQVVEGLTLPTLTHLMLAVSQYCSAFWVTETEMGLHR